jgi:hypothetical protein
MRAKEPEKSCERCGSRMRRKRFNGRLEDMGAFKRRRYCSLHCANQRDRPKHWETYHWRARQHRKSSCEACGSMEALHAHHVDGQPENNEPSNIQTLCVFCHNFLHATAERLGWTQPGRLPPLETGWTDLAVSGTASSLRSRSGSGGGSWNGSEAVNEWPPNA